jgi:hypothetical protein
VEQEKYFILTKEKIMKKIITILFLLFICISDLLSLEITEGTEFWFGLPYCKKNKLEFALGMYPIEIWISSKYDTKLQ